MAIDAPRGPTDLFFVGPATATVFEGAPFAARDVADRRVSYRSLLDAGVAADVADRLRREYSLVWSFEWQVGGDDLPRRAESIRGLGPEERAWIAESGSGDDGSESANRDRWGERRRYLEAQSSEEPVETAADGSPAQEADPEEATCPRCEGALETFVLGDSETVRCTDCGYAGVETR